MSEWEPFDEESRRARGPRSPGERRLATVPRGSVSRPAPEPPAAAQVLSDAAWAPVSPDLDGFIRLEDLFGILRRRRRVLLIAFLLVAIPAVTASLTQESLYESTTMLFVKFGREFVYRAEMGDDRVFINRNQETVINSELQILSSDGVIGDAIRSIGVEQLYPELVREGQTDDTLLQRAVSVFRTHLDARAVPSADVIRVAYRHPDPNRAAQGVTALIDRFMDKRSEIFSDREAISFLREKVPIYERQLEAAERALRDFQARYPDFSPRAPREAILQERMEIDAQISATRDEIARVRAEPEAPAVSAARAKLLELQLKEQRMRGGISRDLEEIRNEIALVSQFLETQLGASGQRNRTRLAHFESELERLRTKSLELDEIFAQLPKLTREHEELVRNRDVAEQRYTSTAKRLADARLSDELNRNDRAANIRVLTKGQVPLAPVTLRREMLIAFGLALALTVAILATFLFEFVSPSH